jgi:sugar phosphate isomerase/epimerase
MRRQKRKQLKGIRIRWGGHSLSDIFLINTHEKLGRLIAAMQEVSKRGGKVFELPYALVGGPITWIDIANAAKETGIDELVICHFWGTGKDGKPLAGDPLGSRKETTRAITVFKGLLGAVEILRENGIVVRYIDGPTHVCLGKKYPRLNAQQRHERMVVFLRRLGKLCAKAKLILAVEFLRPVEDTVVHGTKAMLKILKAVNHPSVKMHFDVFHSVECGEDPALAIVDARKWIAYLHLHGDKRLAPGAKGDRRNWKRLVWAILQIDSGIVEIIGVSEPFGKDTCAEEPSLGAGLPEMCPLPEYLDDTLAMFRKVGMPLALAA